MLVLIACGPVPAAAQDLGRQPDFSAAGAFRGLQFDTPTQPQGPPALAGPPKRPATRRGRWTGELHIGLVRGSAATGGTSTLPLAGPSFVTVSGVTSPAVSSWYFGAGAQWLNQDLTATNNGAMSAIDPILTADDVERARGRVFGGRVARALSNRVDLEVTIDGSSSAYGLTASTLGVLQASANSFRSSVARAIDAFSSLSVTSVLSGTTTPGDQFFATTALNFYLRRGRFSPYVTGGAGAAVNHGSVSATLTGLVKYSINGLAKTESDVVNVNFTERTTEPAAVLGAGFTQDFSPRTGVRVDLRLYLSANPDRTTVSAAPSTTGSATVEDIVPVGLHAIQFSGVAGTPSTLSVPVSNFQTFTGAGTRRQATFLVGYFVRF